MKTMLFAIAASLLLARSTFAVQIHAGDIVTPQFDNFGTIIVVHPETGKRETLSLYPSVGNGPREGRPSSILMMPGGDFLVTETLLVEGLYLIDHETGDRTFVSGTGFTGTDYPANRGSGPIDSPSTVLRTPGGDIIVVNQGGFFFNSGFVTRVDLATGDRTLLSGLGSGSGTNFDYLTGGALDASGQLIVGDYNLTAVFRVDLTTGARTVISGLGHGSGPELGHLMDLVVMPNGEIIAESRAEAFVQNDLFRIDPITGDRTIISTRPHIREYARIALGSNGKLLGAVPGFSVIFEVDPTDGSETIVSAGLKPNTGPPLFWGDMVVVPEPSAMILLIGGGVLVALAASRRKIARHAA